MATTLGVLADLVDPPKVDVFGILEYVPEPKQQEFHDATEDDVFYGGAAGGGKTKALLMHGIRACVDYPGLRVGAFRRTYDELAESFFKELQLISHAEALGAKWNGTERELRFPNTSVIRFRYLETVLDATRRQGGEYQLVLIDERTLIDPAAVSIVINERIRSGRRDIPVLGVRSASNPGGAGHGQVKARYIVPTEYGRITYRDDENGRTVRFIPAKVTDNSHLDDAYLQSLDGITDPARRAAMRDGSWDVFAGQFFSEWRHGLHVVKPFAVPAEWWRVTGTDYGYAAPWCTLWAAVDQDRRVWVYREVYDTQVGEREQARRILELEGALAVQGGLRTKPAEVVKVRAADPSMWAKTSEANPVADTYLANGVPLQKANNDRKSGWQRVHTYLSPRPACAHHRQQGLIVCPGVHVFDTCSNLIRTLPDLPHDTQNVEDVDTKAEDHAADAFRYLLMTLPEPKLAQRTDEKSREEKVIERIRARSKQHQRRVGL